MNFYIKMKHCNCDGHAEHEFGFSLVELLVIIGIIGLLATIVFPTVNYFRSKAHDAAAVSYMHTIMTFEDVYYADSFDYIALPPVMGAPPVGHPIYDYPAPTGVGFQLGLPRSGTMVFYVGHVRGSRFYGVSRVINYLIMFRLAANASPAILAQTEPVNVLLDSTWGTRLK